MFCSVRQRIEVQTDGTFYLERYLSEINFAISTKKQYIITNGTHVDSDELKDE